jgi:predicted ATPase
VALIDRTRELSVLTGLLEDAQAGNSAAMVLLGEPGIGKTVLLSRRCQDRRTPRG